MPSIVIGLIVLSSLARLRYRSQVSQSAPILDFFLVTSGSAAASSSCISSRSWAAMDNCCSFISSLSGYSSSTSGSLSESDTRDGIGVSIGLLLQYLSVVFDSSSPNIGVADMTWKVGYSWYSSLTSVTLMVVWALSAAGAKLTFLALLFPVGYAGLDAGGLIAGGPLIPAGGTKGLLDGDTVSRIINDSHALLIVSGNESGLVSALSKRDSKCL